VGFGKKSRTGKVSARFELDQYGELSGVVHLNVEREEDLFDVQKDVFKLLRGKKVTLIYGRPMKRVRLDR
jgi:hypothetical protein